MKKYIYLLKNIGLLTLSNFGSKLLHFFLVPLYTSVLSTSEYGIYDLLTVTISLMIPILTMSIMEATFRFALDEDCDLQEIFSISCKVVTKGLLVFSLIVTVNYFTDLIPTVNEYLWYFVLMFVSTIINQLLESFARGVGKVTDIAIGGIINSFFVLTLNVYFLVVAKMGLHGYFLANIIALTITSLYYTFRIKIQKYISYKKARGNKEKEMMQYSRPLVINSMGWWINNVSDRYIVTFLCGVNANGIYSVAYKIPSLLSIVQTIFNTAWQLSTVEAYNKNDEEGFFKNIYTSYNVIMVLCCSGMIMLTRFMAKILYADEFYEAWKYVPFLMISVVFGAMVGVFGGVFQAVKDSQIQKRITVIGAVVNIVFNIILVAKIGALGAAIATALSYFVVWILSFCHVKKYICMRINFARDLVSYVVLVIQAVLMLLFENTKVLYGIQSLFLGILLFLYCKEILELFKKLKSQMKNVVKA